MTIKIPMMKVENKSFRNHSIKLLCNYLLTYKYNVGMMKSSHGISCERLKYPIVLSPIIPNSVTIHRDKSYIAKDAQSKYFSLLVAYAAPRAARAPMKRHTEMAFGLSAPSRFSGVAS